MDQSNENELDLFGYSRFFKKLVLETEFFSNRLVFILYSRPPVFKNSLASHTELKLIFIWQKIYCLLKLKIITLITTRFVETGFKDPTLFKNYSLNSNL
jgi:hypothetical protein